MPQDARQTRGCRTVMASGATNRSHWRLHPFSFDMINKRQSSCHPFFQIFQKCVLNSRSKSVYIMRSNFSTLLPGHTKAAMLGSVRNILSTSIMSRNSKVWMVTTYHDETTLSLSLTNICQKGFAWTLFRLWQLFCPAKPLPSCACQDFWMVRSDGPTLTLNTATRPRKKIHAQRPVSP